MNSKALAIKRILFTALWIRLTFGFVADEFYTDLEQLSPFMKLLFDAVIVMLGLITIRKKSDFIIAGIAFAITGYATLVQNGLDVLFYLNGMRDFIGYIFILPIIHYFADNEIRWQGFIKTFDKSLFVFLCLQAFCVTWQFFEYGAGDHGGGSLGNWHSGIISTLIFLSSFYLLQKRIDRAHFWTSLKNNSLLIILLFPTTLNETKVSFVFMVMYFLLLIPIDREALIRITLAIPILILSLWGAATAYVVSTGGEMGDVFSLEYYIQGYMLAEDDESEKYAQWLVDNDSDEIEDIPRVTKLLMLSDIYAENPGTELLGQGVGHFKGGTIVPDSDFFNLYKWLLIGSIPYSFHVIIQLGFVGLLLTLAFFLYAIFFMKIDMGNGTGPNRNIQLYVLLTLLLNYLYIDSMRNSYMMILFLVIIAASKTCAIPQQSNHIE